jgi:hypothetical protein
MQPTQHTPYPASAGQPDPERHERKCSICNHADRDEIEQAFLRWEHIDHITRYFKLPTYRAIYRHAHATGLIIRRRNNIFPILENILETSRDVVVSGDTLLRALRMYTHLNETGRCSEPPTQFIHTVHRDSTTDPLRRSNDSFLRVANPVSPAQRRTETEIRRGEVPDDSELDSADSVQPEAPPIAVTPSNGGHDSTPEPLNEASMETAPAGEPELSGDPADSLISAYHRAVKGGQADATGALATASQGGGGDADSNRQYDY